MRNEAIVAICLVAITFGAYYPALSVRLVADDFRLVDQVNFGDALQSLRQTVGYGRNEYRPMVAFSFALSNAIWQGDPRGYHLDSILLHASVVVLVFCWLRLLMGSPLIPGLAALLFAVHPIHHARVTWIAARDSLLSTLFILGALIAYTLARRRPAPPAGKRTGSPVVLLILSLVFFILSLMSYEGSVVLPGILFGLEAWMLATPGEKFRARAGRSLLRILPYTIVLALYLAGWALLFRGEVGLYDLSITAGNLAGNYYSLLYRLFHDHQHLAGVLYFILVLLMLRLPRERRALALFSLLLILVSYLPYAIIRGFASRFAYGSAIGYALLVTLPLAAGLPRRTAAPARFPRGFAGTAAALVLAVLIPYYALELRGRIADWKTAGEIADCIPREIKTRYPDLRDGTALVLARIPRMYGHAYLYPLGLGAAIRRHYPGRDLHVWYGPGELSEISSEDRTSAADTLYFQYIPDAGCLKEIRASQ